MSASIKRLALIALLSLLASAARSDGVGSFDNNRGIFGSFQSFGGAGSSAPPPVSGALLLEDGSSILLLEDGSSHFCLEGGC